MRQKYTTEGIPYVYYICVIQDHRYSNILASDRATQATPCFEPVTLRFVGCPLKHFVETGVLTQVGQNTSPMRRGQAGDEF